MRPGWLQISAGRRNDAAAGTAESPGRNTFADKRRKPAPPKKERGLPFFLPGYWYTTRAGRVANTLGSAGYGERKESLHTPARCLFFCMFAHQIRAYSHSVLEGIHTASSNLIRETYKKCSDDFLRNPRYSGVERAGRADGAGDRAAAARPTVRSRSEGNRDDLRLWSGVHLLLKKKSPTARKKSRESLLPFCGTNE